MSINFTQKQETQADNYLQYSSIPFHMLQYIDFSDEHVVQQTSDIFCVPEHIAFKRIQK
ncbi:hypothetical protein PGRAN_11233 [Listeria grandensis FSL F6-0971]|uniref:Uncharacterized protein n=1 Tax=Listeria grandensis FSL F6-0971 TaxID=1265819 RepID=W7B6P7_9LIST|nr:hypothetical protein PGRAN_11233 [Listeria grandensis FSL F6-0971]